jgi:hypothetical protein
MLEMGFPELPAKQLFDARRIGLCPRLAFRDVGNRVHVTNMNLAIGNSSVLQFLG